MTVQTEQLRHNHKQQRIRQRILTVLAAIVVFCTTYALILPAITWERQLICEKKEHTHTSKCYETVEIPASEELICTIGEHTHDESCYSEREKLVCNLKESKGHTHSDDCYDEDGELICEREESEGHTHTDECYETETVLTCTLTEHEHDGECYKTTEARTEKHLICEKEEHTHTDACFDAPPKKDDGYYCGKIEHTHNEYCYFEDGTLRCTIKEHTHTLVCESNTEADVETDKQIEYSLRNVDLSGAAHRDMLAVAKTQLGYTASTKNFAVEDDEIVGYYSRYGAWHGDEYAAWNTLFVGFCLEKADIDAKEVPFAADVKEFVKALAKKRIYKSELYVPEAGDILFYNNNEENLRAAIVESVSRKNGKTLLTAIEGDVDGKVVSVSVDTEAIVGYGVLPADPASGGADGPAIETPEGSSEIGSSHTHTFAPVETELVSKAASDGAVAVITGMIPEGASAEIEAVELTGDDLVRLFGKTKAASMRSFVAYDIRIMLDGEEWQPDENVSVTVRKPAIEVSASDTLAVAHVSDSSESVTTLEASLLGGGIAFDTDGFSLYVFYTVDFHYDGKVFSINGYDSIYLSELFDELGIGQNAADAVNVYFSDDTLVSVTKKNGDWLLTSLKAFDTAETLYIDFGDGNVFELTVTDAAEYWKKVDKITDTNADYLIVRGGKALNASSTTAYNSTAVSFTAVSGNDGYYTASSVADNMRFKFSAAVGTGGTTTLANGSNYLVLGYGSGSPAFSTTSRDLDVSYSSGNWYIKRNGSGGSYYLSSDSSGTFSRQTLTSTSDNEKMTIYQSVSSLPTPKEYWVVADKIDDDGADYLIVRGGKALNVTATNSYNSAAVTFTPVSGQTGYYTATVSDTMRMKFSSAIGTSGTAKISNGTNVLNMGGTNKYSTSGRDMTVTYSGGTWTIKRGDGNYWLSADTSGAFSRYDGTTAGDNQKLTIYKSVSSLPAVTKEYWVLTDKIDDITTEYMIVKDDYALTYSSGIPITGTKLNLKAVSGKTGYYTTDVTVTKGMRLKFATKIGSSGTSVVQTAESTNHYLYLNNEDVFKTTSRSIRFNYTDGHWLIDNNQSTAYYLTESSGSFNRSNSTSSNSRNMQIYKKVIETSGGGEEPEEPEGPDITETSLYYRRVDEIKAGKEYIIVSAEGSYAITYNGTSISAVPLDLEPVKGNPGIFKVENTTTNMYWTFPQADGSSTVSSRVRWKNTGKYLTLDSSMKCDSTNHTLTAAYDDSNGTWELKDSSYYLRFYEDAFSASSSTNNTQRRDMIILEKTTEPTIPEDPVQGGSSAQETPTKPTYPAYTAVSGAKDGVTTSSSGVDGKAYSDPATSQLESRFESLIGTKTPTAAQIAAVKENDGRVLSDKSVVYKKDDYGAFKNYPDNTFGVTMSLLGQTFAISENDRVPTPVDVVFVLDVSGSMSKSTNNVDDADETRRDAMVDAVNTAIDAIMEQHEDNRVGVVLYSSGSWDLLELDHYKAGTDGKYVTLITDSDKDTDNNINVGDVNVASGVKTSGGKTVSKVKGTHQQQGTYTQSGIARGSEMLERVTDTDYTVSLGIEESARTYTTERQPVFILLSDGDPTHSNPNYMDVLSGPHYGDGSYNSNSNNKGIHGYYTILSANYYKNMVGIHYKKPAKFYTVGMGINAAGVEDLSESSITGDHYKRAVLNPTSSNITDLSDSSAKNPTTTSYMLRDLLGNKYTDQYVTVSSRSASGNYAHLGSPTLDNEPVLPNPYKSSGYSYADAAYFGNLDSEDLETIFTNIIEGSLKYKSYGFILQRRSSAEMDDPIGEGMQLVSDPVLNYDGKNYTHTSKTTSGNVTSYTYNYNYYAQDGSEFSARLDEIKVTVTTDPSTGLQNVHMIVPDDVLPSYSPCETVGVDWYYESLPVRLIYQVGLTEKSKADIAYLANGETATFYTNRFDVDDYTVGAGTTLKPTTDNPYYGPDGSYQPSEHDKTDNTTDTAGYFFETVEGTTTYGGEKTQMIRHYLGNNGKLVFTGNGANTPIDPDKEPDHFKWIDAFRDGDDNPDTELDDDATDLTDLYRLYLNIGPESAYEAIDVLFVLDRSSSMATYGDGDDAYDILGHGPLWRNTALNSLLNGLPETAKKGDNNYSTLYPNGIVSKIMAVNERNKIAVVNFAADGNVVYSWSSNKVVGDNRAETGTNYMAGLSYAQDMLNDEKIKNDGRKKYMIFFSDGDPLNYSPSLDDVETNTRVYNTNNATLKARTEEAIALFRSRFPDLTIYSVGIGDFNYDYLNQISTSGTTIASTDFQKIMTDLDDVVTHGVGHFNHLKIVDTLSDDLEYADPLDLIVRQVPNESTTGDGKLLYANGEIIEYDEDEDGEIDEPLIQSVDINRKNKTITVTFVPDYEEQGGYRYSLSYNVRVPQSSYDKYAANVAAGKNGYGGKVGDPLTDYIYNDNKTSSGKPGFLANSEAHIEYQRVRADGTIENETAQFDHPVVQVDTDKIDAVKVWSDGNNRHSSDTVTVAVQMKYKGSFVDTGISAVLSEKNAWRYTFTDLPKGYEYRVVETVGKTDYTPRYTYDDVNCVWTVTNMFANVDVTLRKTDSAGNLIKNNAASFELYEDAACTVLAGTYQTGTDGTVEMTGLCSGMTYYLRETKAPNGYRILPEVKSFTVKSDGTIKTPVGDSFITTDGSDVTVKNTDGYTLPRTGGMGAEMLYVLGALLVLGSFGYLFFVRRRTRK